MPTRTIRTSRSLCLATLMLACLFAGPSSWAGESVVKTVELPDAKSGKPYVLNISKGGVENLPVGLQSADEILAAFRRTGDIVYAIDIRVASGRCAVLERAGVAALAEIAPSRAVKNSDVVKNPRAGNYLLLQRIDGGYAIVLIDAVSNMKSAVLSWVLNPGGDAPFRSEDLAALLDVESRALPKLHPDVALTVLDVRDPRIDAQSRLVGLIYQSAEMSDQDVKAEFQRALADGVDVNEPIDPAGLRPLSKAAWIGSKFMVEILVEAGAKIDESDALHAAADGGRKEICEFLIAKGADRSHRNKEGLTAFEVAVHSKRSNVELLNLLQPAGAGALTLHSAAVLGQASRVKALIAQGTDINAYDSAGKTPLHLAAEAGQVEVCQILMAAGADIEKGTQIKNVLPLVLAVQTGQKGTVQVLLEKASQRQLGQALYEAVLKKRLDISEEIIERAKDVSGLYRGAQAQLDSLLRVGRKDLYSLLARKGVALPIWAAAAAGDTDTLKKAVDAGKGIDEQGTDFLAETPLQAAVRANQPESATLLLRAGANPNAKAKWRNGNTPLLDAVDAGHDHLVAILLQNKAAVDLPNDQGYTPLYEAATQGRVSSVKLLLESGASPNNIPALRNKDGKGSTLIEKTRNQEVIQLLRAHGVR